MARAVRAREATPLQVREAVRTKVGVGVAREVASRQVEVVGMVVEAAMAAVEAAVMAAVEAMAVAARGEMVEASGRPSRQQRISPAPPQPNRTQCPPVSPSRSADALPHTTARTALAPLMRHSSSRHI